MAQVVVILTQHCADIKHTWELLDTCSKHSISKNIGLEKEIITCKNHEKLTVSTNGGLKSFDKKATLNLFPMTLHFKQNFMETDILFKGSGRYPGGNNQRGQ